MVIEMLEAPLSIRLRIKAINLFAESRHNTKVVYALQRNPQGSKKDAPFRSRLLSLIFLGSAQQDTERKQLI
jgi:hypothetical protein